jgi:hypothetical protein
MANLTLAVDDTICAATLKALIAQHGISGITADDIYIGSGHDTLGRELLEGISASDVFIITSNEGSSLANASLIISSPKQRSLSIALKLSPERNDEYEWVYYTDLSAP